MVIQLVVKPTCLFIILINLFLIFLPKILYGYSLYHMKYYKNHLWNNYLTKIKNICTTYWVCTSKRKYKEIIIKTNKIYLLNGKLILIMISNLKFKKNYCLTKILKIKGLIKIFNLLKLHIKLTILDIHLQITKLNKKSLNLKKPNNNFPHLHRLKYILSLNF